MNLFISHLQQQMGVNLSRPSHLRGIMAVENNKSHVSIYVSSEHPPGDFAKNFWGMFGWKFYLYPSRFSNGAFSYRSLYVWYKGCDAPVDVVKRVVENLLENGWSKF